MGKDLAASQSNRYQWLKTAALILALAMGTTRCLTSEFLRDPTQVIPGAQATPRGVGAAIGVMLDLASCLPAILVLLYQAMTRTHRRNGLAPVLFLIFAAVAAISFCWASDRYAAAVGAAHLLAAGALLWAIAQIVCDWTGLASVAAVSLGLLLCLLAQGIYYDTVELPDVRDQWTSDVNGMRTKMLHAHNWQQGSFAAKQFELKVLHGDFGGFYTSANTYAGMLALLAVVVAGLFFSEMRHRKTLALLVLPIPIFWMLWLTQCKAAFVTLFLAIIAFLLLRFANRWISRYRRRTYFVVLGLALCAIATTIAYGLRHGNLHNDSLNFRWRYWVASAHMFAQHPLLGVGWNNFGEHYLHFRLPASPEEIKDPHDMLVRVFTELGIVGGAVFVAFLLIAWWRMSDGSAPAPEARPIIGTGGLTLVAIVAMAINVGSCIDFSQIPAFVFIEMMRRFLFLALLLIAIIFVIDPKRKRLTNSPLPWLPAAMGIGLGLFLIHNLIDFVMFDPSPGPLMLFALLAGSLIGIHSQQTAPAKLAWTKFGIGVMVFLLAAGVFVTPVVLADADAQQADNFFRQANTDRAIPLYAMAEHLIPYNPEYPFCRAEALIYGAHPDSEIDAEINRSIAEDPFFIDGYLLKARYGQREANPDTSMIIAAYKKALVLNPNDVGIRLEYAELLKNVRHYRDAIQEYQKALWFNDQFPLDEAKRLPEEQVNQVRQTIAQLERNTAAPNVR